MIWLVLCVMSDFWSRMEMLLVYGSYSLKFVFNMAVLWVVVKMVLCKLSKLCVGILYFIFVWFLLLVMRLSIWFLWLVSKSTYEFVYFFGISTKVFSYGLILWLLVFFFVMIFGGLIVNLYFLWCMVLIKIVMWRVLWL